MRLSVLVFFLMGVCTIVSCEKEADVSDFVSQDLFEEAIGLDGDNTPENIPSEDNPVVIGTINNEDFESIGYQGTELIIDQDNSLLTLFFLDANDNELLLKIENPETKDYTFEENEPATFEASFFNSLTGESYSNLQRDGANSNSGSLSLVYIVNDNGDITVSAQFSFIAFLESTDIDPPVDFVEFVSGNFENLSVEGDLIF